MSVESLIAQIQALAAAADDRGRAQIQDAVRDLQVSIEGPVETLMRLSNSYLQIAIARLGVDLGLFQRLVDSKDPLTVDELAASFGVDSELLGRLLRYLGSVGMVKETGKDHFQGNKFTEILANPAAGGFIHHAFDTVAPVVQVLPDFLAETQYRNITDNTKTPFQKAFNTDLPQMTWFATHPKHMSYLQQSMVLFRSNDWLSSFPMEQAVSSWDEPEKPFFVDVGGGYGHQCVGLREKCPTLRGSVVLQDLPETVQNVKPIEGVQIMAHDFFQPQPVHGARFYYLRRIFHDYPDEKCITILQNLLPALGSGSQILIDEMVLPDSHVPWQATMTDLSMMMSHGGKERTRQQWTEMIEGAGFQTPQIHTYSQTLYQSIIVVGLK